MTASRPYDWINISFLGGMHLLALGAIVYAALGHVSIWSMLLLPVFFVACGLGITAGYHRCFAHKTHEASAPLRFLYLLFGAGSVQNSALKWCADHRIHHSDTDTELDPYDINRGFWWAHLGWILFRDIGREKGRVADLAADPLIRFQDTTYALQAATVCLLLPALIGMIWGDPLGAVLMAGILRLVLQWHATFAVNSWAHSFGSQPFGERTSARNSFLIAVVGLGEGYHNFHHRFPSDYRNGIRWFDLDPTKWFVWTMSKLRLASGLRKTPPSRIERARAEAPTK